MAEETTRRIPQVRQPFHLNVTLPGSKSIALRHVLMSLLAAEPTRLRGIPRCDDLDVMFDATAALGASVERSGKNAHVIPPKTLGTDDVTLHLGMSGVSLRLLLAAAMLRNGKTRFDGHPQLHKRPNADLLSALRQVGCSATPDDGFLPIEIRSSARLGNETTLSTGVTSQFLSALMLAAARLPEGLTIHLQGERTSASYIGVTEAEMARRGAAVSRLDEHTVFVPPSTYSGGEVVIEGDASAATYHAALATLHQGCARLANLGTETKQGDYGFIDVCEQMGARVERLRDSTTIRGPRHLATVGTVDMKDMPDAAPTLMAMAPFLPEPTQITGLATLRVKECDRIAAGAAELRKAGVQVEEYADAMTIHPAAAVKPAAFETYEDHRMAMALSVLASKIGDCRILGANCVSKTYADYWEDFAGIYGTETHP